VTQPSRPPAPRGPVLQAYAGERLGLPADGPGSVASWRRRVLALALDWVASMLVAAVLAGPAVLSSRGWEAWMPLLVFWLEASVLTALAGGSFGQLALRVAVVRLDRRPVSLLVAVLRTLLICVVVPPVIYNRDRRGLHDLVCGTITLRR
jgi:uncharacterized RDD family membrane protein YckC